MLERMEKPHVFVATIGLQLLVEKEEKHQELPVGNTLAYVMPLERL